MSEDPDPGDITNFGMLIQDVCNTPPESAATMIEQYDSDLEKRDHLALLADNARKLAEICALKEQLAALQAPVPEKKPSFPVRALRHRHQAMGIFVPACFRG